MLQMTFTRNVVKDLISTAAYAKKDFFETLTSLKDHLYTWNEIYFDYTKKMRRRLPYYKNVANLTSGAFCHCFKRNDWLILLNALKYCNKLIIKLREGAPLQEEEFDCPIFKSAGIRYKKIADDESIFYDEDSIPKFGRMIPITKESQFTTRIPTHHWINNNWTSEENDSKRVPIDPSDPEQGFAVESLGFIYSYSPRNLTQKENLFRPIGWNAYASWNDPPGKPNVLAMVSLRNHSGEDVESSLTISCTNPPFIYEEDYPNGTSKYDALTFNEQKFSEVDLPNVVPQFYSWDPLFDWQKYAYDLKNTDGAFSRELNCLFLWRGWFGSCASWHPKDLFDTLVLKPLAVSGWDKMIYQAACDFIGNVEMFSYETKADMDWLFSLYTEGEQAPALYQLGNLWAIRHELVRVLAAQIYRVTVAADVPMVDHQGD